MLKHIIIVGGTVYQYRSYILWIYLK